MEKADLVKYRAMALEVRQLRSLLSELEAATLAIAGPDFSGMPRGGASQGSALESRVVRYLDTVALYREKTADLTAALYAVETAIGSLDSPTERLIMRLRYIKGRSWPSVCLALQALGYSERQVYRLHGSALMKLREVTTNEKG